MNIGITNDHRGVDVKLFLTEFLNGLGYNVIDYGTEASEFYGIIRNELVRRGMVIGALDMLIAAHAMSNKLVLITHNTAEFGRISGLEIEDWHA